MDIKVIIVIIFALTILPIEKRIYTNAKNRLDAWLDWNLIAARIIFGGYWNYTNIIVA